MTRRDFLKTTSAALAAAGTVATVTRLAAQVPTNGRRPTDVVIFLYDRMTALDAIVPYDASLRLRRARAVRSEDGGAREARFGSANAECRVQDQEMLSCIRLIDQTTK